MPAELVLALDQGTTSSRALVVDAEGRTLGSGQHELAAQYPHPGWVEQDPEEIWSGQAAAAAQALAAAGVSPSDLAAVGITNQRETTVLWDRVSGRPLHAAIVWQDRRTAAIVRGWLERDLGELIVETTGLVPDAYFSASKIRWLLDNVPGAAERAAAGELAFGTIDSWLLWKLTRGTVHATDVTNASRTMLFDLDRLEWSEELLTAFGIPQQLLPEVRPSSGAFAVVAEGLPAAGTKIAALAGDQHAATFGQSCFAPGMSKCTYGTGCFIVHNTGVERRRSASRLLSTVAWSVPAAGGTSYALEGSVFIAGAAVQWLRDGLGIIRDSAEVEALARSVPDNGGVCFVPAFTGLGAPYWDPDARGTVVGVTRGTTGGHLARATLEAIALQVADVIEALQADSGTAISELRVDGGATANDLLMQLQADALGVPVVRAAHAESTALGAAFMAGLAEGVWQGTADLEAIWRSRGVFEPRMTDTTRAEWRNRWREAVNRSRSWA